MEKGVRSPSDIASRNRDTDSFALKDQGSPLVAEGDAMR